MRSLPQRPYWRVLRRSPVFGIPTKQVECSNTGIWHGPLKPLAKPADGATT